jgi:hypothetical protein
MGCGSSNSKNAVQENTSKRDTSNSEQSKPVKNDQQQQQHQKEHQNHNHNHEEEVKQIQEEKETWNYGEELGTLVFTLDRIL